MRLRNILCTALALCSPLIVATTQADKSLSIYQNSSAELRVEQFSSEITRQFSNTVSDDTNAAIHSRITSAITNSYHPKQFEKHILEAIETTLNWRERNKIVEWLDTPLGRKASLAEAVALVNANRDGMSATIDRAKALESASKARLVDVVEMAAMESALQLDVTVFQTSIAAFASNAPQPGFYNKDYTVFQRTTNSRLEEIASLNKNFSRSLLAVAYSDFSKAEMKAVISFWGSPTGSRYSVALRHGIKNAFDEANRNFNNQVRQIVDTSTLASAE